MSEITVLKRPTRTNVIRIGMVLVTSVIIVPEFQIQTKLIRIGTWLVMLVTQILIVIKMAFRTTW